MEDKSIEEMIEEELKQDLRDKFAMSALTGILACRVDYKNNGKIADSRELRCKLAYKYADEMLKAREVKE